MNKCQYSSTSTAPLKSFLRASRSRKIAATSISTTNDIHVRELEVRAASTPTQDIVVPRCRSRRPRHPIERDAIDLDTVRRRPRRSTIEVILLDVDAVDGDAGECDVLV